MMSSRIGNYSYYEMLQKQYLDNISKAYGDINSSQWQEVLAEVPTLGDKNPAQRLSYVFSNIDDESLFRANQNTEQLFPVSLKDLIRSLNVPAFYHPNVIKTFTEAKNDILS